MGPGTLGRDGWRPVAGLSGCGRIENVAELRLGKRPDRPRPDRPRFGSVPWRASEFFHNRVTARVRNSYHETNHLARGVYVYKENR